MSNPTIGNESQFTNPIHLDGRPPSELTSPILGVTQFDRPIHLDSITPVSFPNPTLGITQFTSPFNILPDVSLLKDNPTFGTLGGLIIPIHLDSNTPVTFPNPTLAADANQFTTDWDATNNSINDLNYPSPYDITPLGYDFGEASDSQYRQENGTYDADTNAAYRNWTSPIGNPDTSGRNKGYENTNFVPPAFIGTIASTVAGRSGIPFVSSIATTAVSNYSLFQTPYRTLPLSKLNSRTVDGGLQIEGQTITAFIEYWDFRSRFVVDRGGNNNAEQAASFLSNKRADGTAAAARMLTGRASIGEITNLIGTVRAAGYAAASISTAGAYSIYNRKTLFGWGDHDNPYSIRNDFTVSSEVATSFIKGKGWQNSLKGFKIDSLLPFRGDRVNVIDFKPSGRTLRDAYQWKKSWVAGALGDTAVGSFISKYAAQESYTNDFIKFYLTGPKLQNGSPTDAKDDIMVFRATITSLSDSFQGNWSPITLIGRADPNYHYTGYNRDVSLDFDVYATSRDEMKFIWRKLNALAGYTAPEYNIGDSSNIAMRAPWMRLTVGDIFVQQPVTLTTLRFDYDTEASWEINIEQDTTNMQVPFKIKVSCQFNMITDYLPQKGGRFFTLAKRHDKDGIPYEGSDNWLSDFLGNVESPDVINRNNTTNNTTNNTDTVIGESNSNQKIVGKKDE